ncbi:hypothetical protein [Sphingomonas panacis]|uniref:hypothetical protein n=1 Tax=Sphingomonas panacis TaxID=1560345 RepID=UPI001237412B|nr:hypothetical protein [Sphingomonas panacis]
MIDGFGGGGWRSGGLLRASFAGHRQDKTYEKSQFGYSAHSHGVRDPHLEQVRPAQYQLETRRPAAGKTLLLPRSPNRKFFAYLQIFSRLGCMFIT